MKLTYPDRSAATGQKWDACWLCGPLKYRALLYFDSCTAEPTVGETITGEASADTGVVEEYTMTSTTAGVMELTSPTGYDSIENTIFSDNEKLDGTNAGLDFALANGDGGLHLSGHLYPLSELVYREGHYYCQPHYRARFQPQDEDKVRVDTSIENDRFK